MSDSAFHQIRGAGGTEELCELSLCLSEKPPSSCFLCPCPLRLCD